MNGSGRADSNHQPLGREKTFLGRLDYSTGLPIMVILMVFILVVGCPLLSMASPHQTTTLEIPVPGNTIPKTLTFPVYEQQGIRYFSAGIGKEERELHFPPSALKLIFVQGERAFMAGVTLEIHTKEGDAIISIPAEETQGPWLFINAPSGKYLIKATSSDGKIVERSVKISENTSTVVHFRWP